MVKVIWRNESCNQFHKGETCYIDRFDALAPGSVKIWIQDESGRGVYGYRSDVQINP